MKIDSAAKQNDLQNENDNIVTDLQSLEKENEILLQKHADMTLSKDEQDMIEQKLTHEVKKHKKEHERTKDALEECKHFHKKELAKMA